MIGKVKSLIRVMKTVENWPTLLRDRLGRLDRDKVYYIIRDKNVILKLAKGDYGILNEIFCLKVYNPLGFEIKGGDIVVDVGAYSGIFTVYAACRSKTGQVFGFEPKEDSYEHMVDNANINALGNIVPMKCALSDKTGEIEMFRLPDNTGGLSVVKSFGGATKSLKMPSITLKDFIKKYKLSRIDFMKMDCEGSEYEILLSSPKDVTDKIKKISMEVHNLSPQKNVRVLRDFLSSRGFKMKIVPWGSEWHMLYAFRE